MLAGLSLLWPELAVAAASPVLIQSAPGRFEIAAVDATIAHGVASAAEETWRVLTEPLALPAGFTSPIFLRILPAKEMAADAAPFRVTVEVGGIVSARLRAESATTAMTRRVLVQSLLMRLAVDRHGVSDRLVVPLWLEHACVQWIETRANAARLDALKQFSADVSPPLLESLLGWQRGGDEPRTWSTAAMWLLAFFQIESGEPREWQSLLLRLLKGDDPLIAVVLSFPGRYRSAEERELWWQTGWHHVRRTRSLPALEAAESRAQLGALARFVFSGPTEREDSVVPLSTVLARADEPVVSAELVRRAAELSKLISILHPFYRNAGLSLADALVSRSARPAKRAAAAAVFAQDWHDATELEAATTAALDRLERGSR